MRGRERNRHTRPLRALPPIEFLNPTNAGCPREAAVTEGRDEQRIEAFCKHAQNGQVAVVVVVVTEEHDRNRRQRVERDRG